MLNSIRFRLSLCLVLCASCALGTLAQTQVEFVRRAVTASATAEQVRFAALPDVYQMRLEVFAVYGATVFDSAFKPGNLLNWELRDQQGLSLADGSYLCVITVKDFGGRTSRQRGAVLLQAGQPTLLNPEQAEPGIRELNARILGDRAEPLVIMPGGSGVTSALLAHDGSSGQLVSGSGGLSFRTGDFFAGKDVEQMRLTPEGNLGLGVKQPQARLDVGGLIRTSEGIVFPDGSVQTTAYVASGRSLNERSSLQRDAQGRNVIEADQPGKLAGSEKNLRFTPSISGMGTTGRMTKWTNGPGEVVGDTQVSEVNGAVVIGNMGATGNLQIFGTATQDVFAGMGPDLANGPAFNFGYAGSSFGRGAGFFNVRPDAAAVAPNPSLRFLTANQQRMIITNTGNVGIGTNSPSTTLEVEAGDATSEPLHLTSHNGNTRLIGRSTNGTKAAPTATLAGNELLALRGRGHTGTVISGNSSASIDIVAAENFSNSNSGGRIVFGTTLNGTNTRDERMRIDHNGNVGIGTRTPGAVLETIARDNDDGHDTSFQGTGDHTAAPWFAGRRHRGTLAAPEAVAFGDTLAGFGGRGHDGSGFTGSRASIVMFAAEGWTHAATGTRMEFRTTSNGASNDSIRMTIQNDGDVDITGTLSKGGGAFKIDHPLDPENKYLYHSFVESPDMKNIYDGVATLDFYGAAEIELPEWFEALNENFRYQLTAIGMPGPNLYVMHKIANNRFKIAGGMPGMEVSWQVTGIRKDAYANKKRIPVEVLKPEAERGTYLHPEAFDQPQAKAFDTRLRANAEKNSDPDSASEAKATPETKPVVKARQFPERDNRQQ